MLAGVTAVLLVLDPGLALLGLLVVPLLAVLSLQQRRRVRSSQVTARSAAGRLSTTATRPAPQRRRRPGLRPARPGGRRLRHPERRACSAPASPRSTSRPAGPRTPTSCSRSAPPSSWSRAVCRSRTGALSTGELLVVLGYLRDLYSPVRALTRLSRRLGQGRRERRPDQRGAPRRAGGAGRLRTPTEAPPLLGPVELRGVVVRLRAGRPVMRDVNLTVARGETVCLFGPSGVGKSTLLLLLLRLWDPDAGSILVDGTDVRTWTRQSVRERIAYVPQDPWLLDATLAQNVAFGSRTATRAQVVEACARTHVDEFVDRLPLAYDTPLGEGGTRLSGGPAPPGGPGPGRRLAGPAGAARRADGLARRRLRRPRDRGGPRGDDRRRTTLLVTHDPALARDRRPRRPPRPRSPRHHPVPSADTHSPEGGEHP